MMMALQPDGRIIAAGNFTTLGGQTRNRIGRLNPDGSLDTTFDPNANSTVNSVVLQPDGKILVGGSFTSIGGANRTYLARLNPDGTADPTLNVSLSGGVSCIALQADGSMILAGVTCRCRPDPVRPGARERHGSRRTPTGARKSSAVSAESQFNPTGRFSLCGSISSVCGEPRSRLARLEAVGTAEHRLECDAQGVTWWRGGASPEISGTWFEISADGTNWTNLGAATRVPGGWRLNTALLALNAQVRARGFHSGGRWNGSLSLIEDMVRVSAETRPVILSNDSSFGFHTNQFGFTVRALPGQAVVIEATTNFVNWVPLQTNLVTDLAQFVFQDSTSGMYPRRYYRARAYTGSLPAPSIHAGGGSLGFQGGGFGFAWSGIPGQTVVIYASTNLVGWLPVHTNLVSPEPMNFLDLGATNFPARFYRLRLP